MLSLACPRCRTGLNPLSATELLCPRDAAHIKLVDGIWRCILPEREAHFAQFIQDYQTVRAGEERGSPSSDYYRALPYQDLTGRFSSDWRIRATSYQVFLNRVLLPLEKSFQRPLTILDVGAGNGWLSNRLADRHHELAAIDLQTNPTDGLGAYPHYLTTFLRVQAEFEYLPFANGSLDLVIYNASFHYAEDFKRALTEALRVLDTQGQIVILDTPLYRSADTGRQMVRERELDFEHRFGIRSNALPSENFLTPGRLSELAQSQNIRWHKFEPFYGLGWHFRPWIAFLRGRRPPATFQVWVGQRLAQW